MVRRLGATVNGGRTDFEYHGRVRPLYAALGETCAPRPTEDSTHPYSATG